MSLAGPIMACCALRLLVTPLAAQGLVEIDFDDRPGFRTDFQCEGCAVPSEYIVNDHYSSLGVRFNSGGGGIAIIDANTPVSAPNVAYATISTIAGPGFSVFEPVTATFALGGSLATVDRVSVALTDASSLSTLYGYDLSGRLLGLARGSFGDRLSLEFPGQIHSILLERGPFAFDDFRFEGLRVVPEPRAFALVGLAASAWGFRALRKGKSVNVRRQAQSDSNRPGHTARYRS